MKILAVDTATKSRGALTVLNMFYNCTKNDRNNEYIHQTLNVHQPISFQGIKKISFLKKSERKFAIIQHINGKLIKNSIKKDDDITVWHEWIKRPSFKKTHISETKASTERPTLQLPLLPRTKIHKKNAHRILKPSVYHYSNLANQTTPSLYPTFSTSMKCWAAVQKWTILTHSTQRVSPI